MKKVGFPINYFMSIWHPVPAFKNRKLFSWPKLILIMVFLNALLTIPVTLSYARNDSITIRDFYPRTFQLVDQEVVQQLSQYEVENGILTIEDPVVQRSENGVVAFGEEDDFQDELQGQQTILIFEEERFVIEEIDQPRVEVNYTVDFVESPNTPEELQEQMDTQWRVQNQVYIVATFTAMVSFMMFVMLITLVFGSAVFLYLTKKGHLTSITTYKESIGVILNCMGASTILGMLYGLIHFNVVWMMTIQMIGLFIMIVLIYFKTQFRDKEIQIES
jgi:maltodextrin utilization protein YvdJ